MFWYCYILHTQKWEILFFYIYNVFANHESECPLNVQIPMWISVGLLDLFLWDCFVIFFHYFVKVGSYRFSTSYRVSFGNLHFPEIYVKQFVKAYFNRVLQNSFIINFLFFSSVIFSYFVCTFCTLPFIYPAVHLFCFRSHL